MKHCIKIFSFHLPSEDGKYSSRKWIRYFQKKKPYLKAITQNLCSPVVAALMGGKRALFDLTAFRCGANREPWRPSPPVRPFLLRRSLTFAAFATYLHSRLVHRLFLQELKVGNWLCITFRILLSIYILIGMYFLSWVMLISS